jgi:uncharacterized protein (TIGR00251 family)
LSDDLSVELRRGRVRFRVRVQPRASRSVIDGVRDGALRVRLTSPPVDGAANAALVELLAETLDVAKRSVHIVAGASSRTKVVDVDGLEAQRAREMIARALMD